MRINAKNSLQSFRRIIEYQIKLPSSVNIKIFKSSEKKQMKLCCPRACPVISIRRIFQFQSGHPNPRLRRSASASRRDSKDAKYREKIAELEDVIRVQTQRFQRSKEDLVS